LEERSLFNRVRYRQSSVDCLWDTQLGISCNLNLMHDIPQRGGPAKLMNLKISALNTKSSSDQKTTCEISTLLHTGSRVRHIPRNDRSVFKKNI
jgi:hypothetical protein